MNRFSIDGVSCESGRIVVGVGDITTLTVDAIVNAANSTLMGGGGVDGAIHRAGGESILAECRTIRAERYPQGLPTGEAVITTAGKMRAKAVIHTVGPVWNGGNSSEDELLAKAYRSSLELAARNGLSDIAFPAISTGVYGFPKQRAAPIVHKTIRGFLKNHGLPQIVYLVFFSQPDADLYVRSARCR